MSDRCQIRVRYVSDTCQIRVRYVSDTEALRHPQLWRVPVPFFIFQDPVNDRSQTRDDVSVVSEGEGEGEGEGEDRLHHCGLCSVR